MACAYVFTLCNLELTDGKHCLFKTCREYVQVPGGAETRQSQAQAPVCQGPLAYVCSDSAAGPECVKEVTGVELSMPT